MNESVFQNLFSYTTPQLIALLTAIGAFFLVIFICVIHDENQNRNSRHPRENGEWLFTGWDTKMYDAFIHTDPVDVLKKLGTETEQYLKDCAVIRKTDTNLKKIAADKILGLISLGLSLVLLAISGTSGILITLVIVCIGIILFQAGIPRTTSAAKDKRKQLENELPRFLDLLQTALYINLPIDEAIGITAKHQKGTLIADELLSSMAETQMGANSWQDSLRAIATRYEVDTFSDFVLYLITGYEKGLSIYDVVNRQAREVRQYALVSAEENANKVSSSILVPIAIFKLLPLLFIVGYPFVIQLTGTGAFFS